MSKAAVDVVPLTDPQREELERRLDALDREGPVGVPWEQVLAELGGTPKRIRSRRAPSVPAR